MIGFLKKLVFGPPTPPKKTTLSETQAIAIAQAADIDPVLKEFLCLANTVERNGRTIWCVSSASKGAQTLVFIDDETGKIVETKLVGKR
jgi:hypothetical protein